MAVKGAGNESALALEWAANRTLHTRMPSPRWLYHGTLASNVQEILHRGLATGSFWGTRRMAEHWARRRAEEASRDGDRAAVLIRRPLASFDPGHLLWDGFMDEEPVWFGFQVEADKQAACARAQGNWEESLAILESVWCRQGVTIQVGDVIRLRQVEMAGRQMGI